MPLRPGMCVHTGTHAYRWSHATGSTRAGHPAAGAAHYGVVSVATAAAPAYCSTGRRAGAASARSALPSSVAANSCNAAPASVASLSVHHLRETSVASETKRTHIGHPSLT